MKKSLLFLMVCLMATASYASVSWSGPSGSWGTASLWQGGVIPDNTAGEVKITRTNATGCDLDVDAGSFTTTKVTVGGNGGLTLNIKTNGKLMEGKEFVVGSGTAGSGANIGKVVQTGGTLTLNDSIGTVGKLEIGYKSGSNGIGTGTYTISGGTINGTGGIYVGAMAGTSGGASGAVGTLTVSGTGSTISVGGPLFVGEGDATGVYTGTGTLTFNVDGGVSAITVAGGVNLSTGVAGEVANLLVNLTGAAATGDILLVSNTGGSAVAGAFTNAAWGSTVVVGVNTYILSDVYDAGTMTDGAGNDIALVVPEPVTIALLGLGFLAIRRKK